MKKSTIIACLSVFAFLANAAHAATYDTLIKFSTTWKYLDDGSSQDATTWKLSTFADATWDSGAAPLGFGDSWIATCIDPGCVSIIPCTPVCLNINITDYFRRRINITATTAYEDSVKVYGRIDDGIVMYVNGTKVWSYNMPATVTSSTEASSTINGADESKIDSMTIPLSVFVNGANTVAVELHQQGGTTSDATFDMMMRFKRKPVVTGVHDLGGQANVFSVSPNPSKGNFTIQVADASLIGTVYMVVYDITGRKVVAQNVQFEQGRGSMSIDAVAGIYFVHAYTGNGLSAFKLTIE